MTISRRHFGLGSLGLALTAFATGAGNAVSRRFLFVHAEGGWDPLCVFAPLFDAPQIDMEPGTQPLAIGNFNLVDSAARPAVPTFFQRWGDQTVLINGLNTRSVNHETCQSVALTGSTSDGASDWATLIAVAAEHKYYLPHLVLNGPSFPGAHTIVVSRAEGLVEGAVNGFVLEDGSPSLTPPSAQSTALVNQFVERRATALAASAGAPGMASSHLAAIKRSQALADASDLVRFPAVEDLSSRASNAITLLADGITRCASVSTDFVWDTHEDNTPQTALFQQLFTDLDTIMETLANTDGPDGNPLADDTVVVVLSEMARTPAYNAQQGRDHWPYTTAMLIGAGIEGNRTIGGYTDLYAGIGVDPKTGELDTTQTGISAGMLGATLLALGDIDPGQHLTSTEVLQGVLT